MRRSLFPKVTVTILEPLRLSVDPALRGKRRRMAAGALLYTVMSDLIFRTTSTDRTIVEAVIAAAAGQGKKHVAVEDPIGGTLTYKRLLLLGSRSSSGSAASSRCSSRSTPRRTPRAPRRGSPWKRRVSRLGGDRSRVQRTMQ